MMYNQTLDLMFQEIKKITGIDDIAYHRIVNDRLCPMYKTQTEILDMEKWKQTHAQNPVHISKTLILQEITKTKSPISIANTHTDQLSADAFFLFGIDSILIIPVMNADNVEGIICIPTMGRCYDFTKEIINGCKELVDTYMPLVVEQEVI